MSICCPDAENQTESALRRPCALLVAYACSPDHGSEAGVGWNRALEAAKVCDTWVLCEETEFAASVRRYLNEHGEIPGLHFEFLPKRPWESWLWRVPGCGYLAYNWWQRRALVAAQALHAKIGFDLVHQITFGTYREPGYMAQLGVPWIWGPFGGTQNFPWRFLHRAGLLGAFRESVRNVSNVIQLHLSPRVRRAARQATVVVAANSTVSNDFTRTFGIFPETLSDVGIHEVATAARRPEHGGPLRILWAAHCFTRKALNLLIEALARLPAEIDYELRVAGDGPAQRRWQRLAERRGVAGRIQWMGRLSHHDTLQAYAWADVFAFTSLRDTTGCVVAEALSNGVPVICLDHQGARDVVTEECGIKVPVTGPRETIARFAEALALLARDPPRRRRLGEGAVRRARDYLWSRQGEQMAALYRRALADKTAASMGGAPLTGTDRAPCLHGRRWSAKGAVCESIAPRSALMSFLRDAVLRASKPLDRWFPRTAAAGFGILLYHRIAAPIEGVPCPTYNVPPAQFRAQMQGLLALGYTAWPLEQALDWHRQQRPIPAKTFVVTFDDGYENNYTQAWPILRELKIPATVFVTTGCLDSRQPFPCDDWTAAGSAGVPPETWRPLSSTQCLEMVEDGLITLGSHTHTHEKFAMRPEDFSHDLQKSLAVLRSRFRQEAVVFAFPFGMSSPALKADVRRAGLLCSLSVESRRVRLADDPLDWGRIIVEATDSAECVAARLDGWYRAAEDAWHNFRRWLRAGRP